uniref:Chitin-binding type-4 domain-containing protein n=1 Tax=Globisporangium ultimum (strain ATCC 200006 / CBS 805.95 / DAOM BR144) TaxID=431595 RepID=K3W944_GLOUD
MKTTYFATTALAATFAVSVQAHGQMTVPKPRPVSTLFRANSGALKNAGDDELQWAPLENLSQRTQADMPQAATFSIMNGCRGMIYESTNSVTTLAPGKNFTMTYFIQAPHPGYMYLNIVKPKASTTGGAIMYEKYLNLLYLDSFANSGGTFSLSVAMPTTVSGCGTAGNCALQMYWHSDIANQTYPTCADIIVSGSGAGSSTATTVSSDAASAISDASTTDESSTTTDESSTTTDASSTSSATSSADADTTTTETPATVTPTPTATKKKCTVRSRRLTTKH